jgi:hypothetical protein
MIFASLTLGRMINVRGRMINVRGRMINVRLLGLSIRSDMDFPLVPFLL